MSAQNPQAARIIPIILKVLAFFIAIRKKIKSYKYITICYIYITFKKSREKNTESRLEKLDYILKYAKKIYVNSDTHSLSSLQPLRKECYDYLQEKGILI